MDAFQTLKKRKTRRKREGDPNKQIRNERGEIIINITGNQKMINSPMVKNPPCNAGEMGSTPGQGTKIPHATEQLNPCTTITESTCSRAHVLQLENLHAATTEAHVPLLESPQTTGKDLA